MYRTIIGKCTGLIKGMAKDPGITRRRTAVKRAIVSYNIVETTHIGPLYYVATVDSQRVGVIKVALHGNGMGLGFKQGAGLNWPDNVENDDGSQHKQAAEQKSNGLVNS